MKAIKRDRIPNRWSVLLIDDVGRTISFYLSKRVGFAIVASLAVVLILFVYFALSFFLMLRENAALRKDFDLLTAELRRAKSDTEKALVQLMLLQESSKHNANKPMPAPVREPENLADPEEETVPGRGAGAGAEVSEEPEEAAAAFHSPSSLEQKTPAPDSELRVAVEKLEIWRERGDNDFRFRYVVKNVNRARGKISGYTFLVLRPHESSAAVPPRAFPDTGFAGGQLSDFRRGLYFSISHYKPVDGRLTDISLITRYKTATVYAYSDTGDLLIEKTFEITKVLKA